MKDVTLLAPWIRRFLLEHFVAERNFSPNTQWSYRDTLRLLIPFVARDARKAIDQLKVEDVSADRIRAFLLHLERKRHWKPATRNQRLASIRSLARFIGRNSPEHLAWCAQIRDVAFKHGAQVSIGYLEKPEMDAVLASPNVNTAQGRRDFDLLLFLYNTGARADEAAQVKVDDLHLGAVPTRDLSYVVIHGKGNKQRECPLWMRTVKELARLIQDRVASDHVFMNRQRKPLTRFGVLAAVKRHVIRAAKVVPSLARKSVSARTIRHTTATHLLRAGVDINTIRAWLGHVSIDTTNVYAEVDLAMKAKALDLCAVSPKIARKKWRDDPDLMRFLDAL